MKFIKLYHVQLVLVLALLCLAEIALPFFEKQAQLSYDPDSFYIANFTIYAILGVILSLPRKSTEYIYKMNFIGLIVFGLLLIASVVIFINSFFNLFLIKIIGLLFGFSLLGCIIKKND